MTQTGALLFDGASRKKALIWLSQTYPAQSASPLLYGTPFEALGDVGPILLDADEGSPVHQAWLRGSADLQHAVWLKTCASQNALYTSLSHRLRILSPDGREFWLRLADARPMLRAWQASTKWPEGFWFGVKEVWLHDQRHAFMAWKNEAPEYDCAVTVEGVKKPVMLDWPLLEALAEENTSPQGATL